MAGSSNFRKKMKSNDPSFTRKKGLDFYPVQRRINFTAEGAVGGGVGLIDVARCGSMINRRLMRQGKLYNCKLEIDANTLAPTDSVEVWVLKTTWASIRAWELAKENFDQSYMDERENISKSQVARYFDFRVDHGLGAVELLVPRADNNMSAAGGVQFDQGEFDLSVVEDQNGVTRSFTWNNVPVGNQYAIFTEYAESSRAPGAPLNTTGDGPYDNLHADSSNIESEALQASGNRAPYSSAMITNGNWVKIATLAMGAASGRFSTAFFDVPCGLIALRVTGQTASQVATGLTLEYKSGDYKGVRAHNMQRM
ncbi:MAG: replication-associated protein [Circoviridae sp.]|nr:MAG: replication-associated protein [Circoviridae sp.]